MAENSTVDFSVTPHPQSSKHDFTSVAGRVLAFTGQYKTPLLLLLIVALAVGISIPVMKYRRIAAATAFARDMHAAVKSLKKEDLYQKILATYGSLPATGLGRLQLAQHYMDNQDPEKALGVIDDGLATANADIIGTLLTLKKADVLKAQGKFKEAADAIESNSGKMLPTFATRAKLLAADLLLSAGLTAEARAILQAVATMGVGQEAEGKGGFDPETVDEAKENLLLLDMGVL